MGKDKNELLKQMYAVLLLAGEKSLEYTELRRAMQELEFLQKGLEKWRQENKAACTASTSVESNGRQESSSSSNINSKKAKNSRPVSSPIVSNTQLILMGGCNDDQYLRSAYKLDFKTQAWEDFHISFDGGFYYHAAVLLNEDIYIIGGASRPEQPGNCFRWSSHSINQFTQIADMNQSRRGIHNSCLPFNNSIWVFGGQTLDGQDEIDPLNSVEMFNTTTNNWELKPSMKHKRTYASAVVILNKFYVCGGHVQRSFLDSVEMFDTNCEIWTEFATLPEPRGAFPLVVEGSCFILFGGWTDEGAQKTVWKLDVEKRKWKELPPMREYRADASAVRLDRGKIFVSGGLVEVEYEEVETGYGDSSSAVTSEEAKDNSDSEEEEEEEALDSSEIFDGKEWREGPSLLEPRAAHTTIVLPDAFNRAFDNFDDE